MLRKREHEELNQLHDGTSDLSAAAMVDEPSERQMYKRYREFFRDADQHRTWNLWNDIPWNEIPEAPASEELIAAVERRYVELMFLPDYSSRALQSQRSSRGRAWFMTRWSYEESKHLLGLQEWLIKRAGYTEELCRDTWERELAENQWIPPSNTPEAVLIDSLAWECYEIEGLATIRDLAVTEGDVTLVRLIDHLLLDDAAHMSFLRESIQEVRKSRPDEISEALEAVCATLVDPGLIARLRAEVTQ